MRPLRRAAGSARRTSASTYDEVGFTREGGAGDQILVPARVVHVLDDAVPLLDAALVEPAAVVLTGLEKVRPRPGLRVLVVGDGTIAMLAVMLVGLMSPAEIVVAGLREAQRELALGLGANDFTIDAPTGGFDLAIEAAGASQAVLAALRLGAPRRRRPESRPRADRLDARPAGRHARQQRPHARRKLRLHLRGLVARRRRSSTPGGSGLRPLVTHRFPIERFREAFAELAEPSATRGKVMLEVAGG